MATKPRAGGGELFYVDEQGNKQDAALARGDTARRRPRRREGDLGQDQGAHPPRGGA